MLDMYIDDFGFYRFDLKDGDGNLLVRSQGYYSWDDAWSGLQHLKQVINSKTWFKGDGDGTGTGTLDSGRHIHFETYKHERGYVTNVEEVETNDE